MLSKLVITFLPRSKGLLISWLRSPSAVILEPKKIKSVTVSTVSPSICHEVMGPDAMIFVFWMLSFQPTFSFSTFTFIKRFFSSSSLSAIWMVSSAHLRLWNNLPKMGTRENLTCLLRNLYAGWEATVRTGHGTTDWFQIGKGLRQGCVLSPCLFNLYAESHIGETLGWQKHKLESGLLGEISITSDMQMTPPLWQKVKRN